MHDATGTRKRETQAGKKGGTIDHEGITKACRERGTILGLSLKSSHFVLHCIINFPF